MDAVRYVLALLILLGLPPGVLLWYFIHPLARFWRRLGWAWTYAILSVPMLVLMVGVYRARHELLAADFGLKWPLVGLGVLCAIAGIAIAVKRRRLLTAGVLAGLPELSPERHPQKLLTEGIYGRIRHPRYVELLLWVLAYALVANYLVTYLAVVIAFPAIYLVVILEERELRDRFGAEYEEYCRRVPRFLPRPSRSTLA